MAGTDHLPDFTDLWRTAGVDFVRSYDWRARLDTVDSPAVAGGDDNGFAVLAGKSVAGDVVQVLVANYAIPQQYLQPGQSTYEFTIPVGPDRAHISFRLLPRRTAAAESNNQGYDLTIRHLPWGRRPFIITRYRVDATHAGEVLGTEVGRGGTAHLSAVIPPPAIELIELRVRQ